MVLLNILITVFLALNPVLPSELGDSVRERPGADSIAVPVSRPLLGISTNIPYDITWIPGYGVTSTPSFSLEFYPRSWKNFTIGADVEWPMWKHTDTHRYMQINNISPVADVGLSTKWWTDGILGLF